MKKEDLINKGFDWTIEKQLELIETYKDRCDTKSIIIVFLLVVISILTCITGNYMIKGAENEGLVKQYKVILKTDSTTINELTHDNMNLVNNK